MLRRCRSPRIPRNDPALQLPKSLPRRRQRRTSHRRPMAARKIGSGPRIEASRLPRPRRPIGIPSQHVGPRLQRLQPRHGQPHRRPRQRLRNRCHPRRPLRPRPRRLTFAIPTRSQIVAVRQRIRIRSRICRSTPENIQQLLQTTPTGIVWAKD